MMIYYSITTFDTLSRLYWWYFCTLKALLPIYLIYSMVICVGTNWWHTPQHLKPKLICNARPLNFPKTQNSEKSIMKAQWNKKSQIIHRCTAESLCKRVPLPPWSLIWMKQKIHPLIKKLMLTTCLLTNCLHLMYWLHIIQIRLD